ncbi:MAG: LacI family DNA-binding transcriptional regulator [Rhizobiaceae bacterium]
MDIETRKTGLPTLEDVARVAGVSTATVSRCLNSPELVTKQTRERILETVKELRYSPNFGARALAAKRTNIYGAVIPTMENAIFARGLQSFQEELVLNGANLLVASTSYDLQAEEEQIRSIIARGADGLLLIGCDHDPEVYPFLQARNIPFVLAWAISPDPEISSVGFDNIEASRQLAKRAIELGHRKFAYISAFTTNNDRARGRVAGVRQALEENGIDPASMPIVETKYSFKCGREAFRKIMQESIKPSIVMCGNDVLAVGAVQAADEMGLQVPLDMSVTGFDDIELATIIRPSITTVHVPHRRMGALAADILLNQVRNKDDVKQVSLETQIITRESLMPPHV